MLQISGWQGGMIFAAVLISEGPKVARRIINL